MFNIFGKSKKICSICGADEQSSKIIYFDPTDRGRLKNLGKAEYVCLNHLGEKWENQLREYRGISICFLPEKGYNSYSYATLDRISDWGVDKKSQEELNHIIDNVIHTKCQICSEVGHFVLFDFSYDGKRLHESNEDLSQDGLKILCADHFIERILGEIKNCDIKIDEIGGTYGDKGVYMQGEF
jgi:hypothetical protein